MADQDEGARTGGRKKKGGGDEADRDTFGYKAEAKSFFKGVLTEQFTDTLVELAADAEVRDRAETFGVKVADAAWQVPEINAKLALVPDIVLRIGTPVFATFVAREVVRDLDRPAEWAREFAQGFARRVRELKKTSASATGTVSAAADSASRAPVARTMSAAEVLAKRPALMQYVERIYQGTEAEEVIARLHRSLDSVEEADMLLVPTSGESVPPVTAAALTAALPVFLVLWPDAAERQAVLSRAERFLSSEELLSFLFSSPSDDEEEPLTAEIVLERLASLEQVMPAAEFVSWEVFERRLALIENSRRDALLGGMRSGVERLRAAAEQVFGSPEAVGRSVDQGTEFFNRVGRSLGARR